METILLERKRRELIDQSKSAAPTKRYKTTRYVRRDKQHVSSKPDMFNRVDMNKVFKENILELNIPIKGETNNYIVTVTFKGILDMILQELKSNNYKLEYKCVYKAIIGAINKENVFIDCTCPDYKYRFRYWSTVDDFNAGIPENRPAKITNPRNIFGAGCKHILNVIGNLNWAVMLATALHNYIKYMDQNYSDKYKVIMFPKIYGMTYQQALDKGIIEDVNFSVNDEEETDDLNVEEDEIDNTKSDAKIKEVEYNVDEEEGEDNGS